MMMARACAPATSLVACGEHRGALINTVRCRMSAWAPLLGKKVGAAQRARACNTLTKQRRASTPQSSIGATAFVTCPPHPTPTLDHTHTPLHTPHPCPLLLTSTAQSPTAYEQAPPAWGRTAIIPSCAPPTYTAPPRPAARHPPRRQKNAHAPCFPFPPPSAPIALMVSAEPKTHTHLILRMLGGVQQGLRMLGAVQQGHHAPHPAHAWGCTAGPSRSAPSSCL